MKIKLENDIIINYYEYNKENDSVILFLHGNKENSHIFDDYIDKLPNYHLIMMDSRCHGESSFGKLTYDLMAEDTYLLLKELGINKCHIVGFSDGGIIGLILSYKYNVVDKLFAIGVNINPDGLIDEELNKYKEEYKIKKDEYLRLMIEEPNITGIDLENIKNRVILIVSKNDVIKEEHTSYIHHHIKNSTIYKIDGSSHYIVNDIENMIHIIKNELMIDVYYEDNHIIIVDKKCGFLSQEDKTKDEDILSLTKSYLKYKYQKPGNVYLSIIQRLDRNVSGLMVLSKTTKATERLNKDRPKKTYLAVSYGSFKEKEGVINYKLAKDERALKAYIDDIVGKEATTRYKVIEEKEGLSLLEVKIDNGRFHQIRFTLSSLGHPIYNDYKYDNNIKVDGLNLGLDAYKVELIHPVTKKMIEIDRIPSRDVFNLFKMKRQ